jgi:hypothetical protein
MDITFHIVKTKVAETHTCFKGGIFYASLHGSSTIPVGIHPVQLICIFFLILRKNTRPCLLVGVLQWMYILPANILHNWVPIREIGSKHPHKLAVRDKVTSRPMIDLHSPPHWKGWHIIISSFIMWWRRGLLSSISILVLIVFIHNDLRIFFRLGFFLGRCWHLDWDWWGIFLFLGLSFLWLHEHIQSMGWVVASS